MTDKVLDGVRVLDFSIYAAGPFTSQLLSQLGAEVIRTEIPGGNHDRWMGPPAPNGWNMNFGLTLHGGKKAITVDIRHPKGKELLKKLIEASDVVIHNFVQSTEQAKVLDYEALRKINPRIILAVVTGFGQTGPYAGRPCLDSIAQAMSGMMSYTGFPGNPPTKATTLVIDLSSGISMALAILCALRYRDKTGKGQMVDQALIDTAVTFVAAQGFVLHYTLDHILRPQIGNASHYTLADVYKAKDGWVSISLVANIWKRFWRFVGRPEFIEDPRFVDDMSRFNNRQIINKAIDEWLAEKTVAEVLKSLVEVGVPCGKVNTVAEMMSDPHVQARNLLPEIDQPEVGKIPLVTVPFKLSETPARLEGPAPKVGEHNEDIYCRVLGLSKGELSQLKEEGVI